VLAIQVRRVIARLTILPLSPQVNASGRPLADARGSFAHFLQAKNRLERPTIPIE